MFQYRPQHVFFNCDPVVLNNASTGPYSYAKIDVLDAAMQNTLYSTGYFAVNAQNNQQSNYNLLNMCTANNQNSCSSLNASSGGTYAVRFTVSTVAYDNAYTSSSTGLIDLNPTLTASNAGLTTTTVDHYNHHQEVYAGPNTSVLLPDLVGRNSTFFQLLDVYTNQTYLSSYKLSLAKYNTATHAFGATLWSESFNACTLLNPYLVPMSVIGGNGFMSSPSNAADGSMWKLSITMTNSCGSYTESTTFKIDDTKL